MNVVEKVGILSGLTLWHFKKIDAFVEIFFNIHEKSVVTRDRKSVV